MATKATTVPASKSASTQQRSVPPSTRQFAKDYAAFHGEAQISDQAYAHAKTIKSGASSKPPSTRQFAQAYQAFYDVDTLNDTAME